MDALLKIDAAKTAIAEATASLDEDIHAKADKRNSLHDEIAALEQELVTKTAEFEQQIANFGEKISQNREIHEKLLTDIEEAEKSLAEALTQLKTVKKKHSDFMEYRKRADAALEAHESAILEKEKQLDTILSTARRRTSILANV